MGFLGNLVLLAVWTAICMALVAGLERIFEAFGYRVTPIAPTFEAFIAGLVVEDDAYPASD